MGQPINPEEFEFTLPAIFFDYNIDWNIGVINIDAHVVSEFEEDSGSIFENKELGLNYLKTLAICRYLITNQCTDYITRLKPYSERPAVTDCYHYHILSFQAQIEDYIDNEIIPARLTDVKDVVGVINKHQLKIKMPDATNMIDTFTR